ncbi:unnamed protein product [Arabis nemorensis]|uniref:RRM domain-containing protein n=1 Tax=Arabis nemorensis TaxID=586526 RepID=A0A565CB13_9BRAS|nr:unnamed protein product [Arabis nemorensis]
MSRVYVGNLDPRVTERELEDEFHTYGVIRSVWVARRPPGYAFLDFDDPRDAHDAIRALDGKNGWRVEHAMSAVSQATLHVNVVTVVGLEGVAAGVGVAVQDTEGARAMDGEMG